MSLGGVRSPAPEIVLATFRFLADLLYLLSHMPPCLILFEFCCCCCLGGCREEEEEEKEEKEEDEDEEEDEEGGDKGTVEGRR